MLDKSDATLARSIPPRFHACHHQHGKHSQHTTTLGSECRALALDLDLGSTLHKVCRIYGIIDRAEVHGWFVNRQLVHLYHRPLLRDFDALIARVFPARPSEVSFSKYRFSVWYFTSTREFPGTSLCTRPRMTLAHGSHTQQDKGKQVSP